MTGDPRQMAELVRKAREAVADLEEPLKTEGFKILLEKLLSGELKQGKRSASGPTRQAGARSKTSAAKHESRAARPKSTLQLDVAALKSLKTYSERFDLQGSEQIAFILANFAREHTDLEFVTAADIEWLYRQLVSQRVKVAAISDLSDWTRALTWLAAPSRRKEWLMRSGEGFIVSNSGLLRFHELEEALCKGGKGAAG